MTALQALAITSHEPSDFDAKMGDLRVFRSIPNDHDVVALRGAVAVFDTSALHYEEVEEDSFYVVENQRPVGGMSWETYDQLNAERGARQARARIQTERRVVRARRCDHDPSLWWQIQSSGYRDGPFTDWTVSHSMIGKVVGIYRP